MRRGARFIALILSLISRNKSAVFCSTGVPPVFGALDGAPLNTGRTPVLQDRDRQLTHRRAGADQIAITEGIVDTTDCGPELMLAEPGRWVRRLLAAIRMFPIIGHKGRRGMRSVL